MGYWFVTPYFKEKKETWFNPMTSCLQNSLKDYFWIYYDAPKLPMSVFFHQRPQVQMDRFILSVLIMKCTGTLKVDSIFNFMVYPGPTQKKPANFPTSNGEIHGSVPLHEFEMEKQSMLGFDYKRPDFTGLNIPSNLSPPKCGKINWNHSFLMVHSMGVIVHDINS